MSDDMVGLEKQNLSGDIIKAENDQEDIVGNSSSISVANIVETNFDVGINFVDDNVKTEVKEEEEEDDIEIDEESHFKVGVSEVNNGSFDVIVGDTDFVCKEEEEGDTDFVCKEDEEISDAVNEDTERYRKVSDKCGRVLRRKRKLETNVLEEFGEFKAVNGVLEGEADRREGFNNLLKNLGKVSLTLFIHLSILCQFIFNPVSATRRYNCHHNKIRVEDLGLDVSYVA